MRINKFISEAGICSRREAEKLILSGLIYVNNIPATIGQTINPKNDQVYYKNKKINLIKKFTYIIINKPVGYICSNSKEQGENIFSLLIPKNNFKQIPKEAPLVMPKLSIVGRLDKDSEGLVFLTNNNELVNKLTHPRFEQEKEYEIFLLENFKKLDQLFLEKDYTLNKIKYKKIKFLNTQSKKNIKLILKEGKNRQIRKTFGSLNYNLISLKRVRIGKIKLNNLPVGKWKYLNESEIF